MSTVTSYLLKNFTRIPKYDSKKSAYIDSIEKRLLLLLENDLLALLIFCFQGLINFYFSIFIFASCLFHNSLSRLLVGKICLTYPLIINPFVSVSICKGRELTLPKYSHYWVQICNISYV